ncbi:MAG: DMT family transporter [Microthrixaceae bacterium]
MSQHGTLCSAWDATAAVNAADQGPARRATPPLGELVLLAVAIGAVSTSAPLIRGAAAPALAIAFWRNLISVPVVGAWVALRSGERVGWSVRTTRERRLSRSAGLLLAAHFATWIPSLSYTSVASSVALVATQPVWAAMIAHRRGEHVARGTWVGIGLALLGAMVLTGVDVSISGRALFGDLLALVGGMFAAAYVTVGAEVRRTVSTGSYALACYATAAGTLLVVCVVSRQALWGFSGGTWWAIGGLVLGAQLLGHTLVNRVLRSISPTIVSVAILFEILGASIIARIAFGETPPVGAWPAALLIGAGVVVVVRSDHDASDLVEPGGVIS